VPTDVGAKRTAKLHVPPGPRASVHWLSVISNWSASTPDSATASIVPPSEPTFSTENCSADDFEPDLTSLKSKEEGLIANSGATPTPVSETLRELASLSTNSVAVASPTAVGRKATWIGQLCSSSSTAPSHSAASTSN